MTSLMGTLKEVCNSLDVSRETSEKLEIYLNLLRKWNSTINLVSKSTIHDAEVRHFADSLQLWTYRQSFDTWMDIGSGAGFPGMVLAITSGKRVGGPYFHLVESDVRKSAFLRNVSRETDTPIKIHSERIEKLGCIQSNIVSARALAPLRQLFEYTEKLLAPDAICLFLKGQNCEKEIEEASQAWSFDVEKFPSRTDPNATVLRIRNVARV